ncbi:FCD domain-containing protein [Cereibacter sphaeroides]|uniref:FadR/GntR family transcriptional regulator n=1 Tax=Cereibacter sphaeroides TaxID=1063 RepID=UPI001F16F8D0|nr:FCD domain-containing protein [Cereibacter sphaeroides]MCE6959849.1 FCD domain-containing protein [Cereibacter sphaeroides]MCE6968683.1 FCD domain-containing protein [Cereibacter sphaeroides]MCE6974703.1 FCD domain-containing protein [Cereibacter sphaeroides]
MVLKIQTPEGEEAGWTPLPQQVARRLQDMIRTGELKPGDRLPSQRVLSERLAVSRASLREALLTLETLGLLRTEPARGTFVTGPSAAAATPAGAALKWRYADSYSAQEVFETRVMLEGRIAAGAAGLIDAPSLRALHQATDEMERCWDAGDLLANVEADLLFHRIIARYCPNRMLQELYGLIAHLLTETQRQPIPRTEAPRMKASLAEHRSIIAALEARDPGWARLAMEAHVRNTAQCAGVSV